MRCEHELHRRPASTSSAFGTKFDSGTVTPVTPSSWSCCERERRKRSSQTTSLARGGSACAASSARVSARRRRSSTLAVCLNVVGEAGEAADAELRARRRGAPFSARSRPGASRSCARVRRSAAPARRCCGASSRSASACSPGVVSDVASRLPFAVDCVAIWLDVAPCSSRTRPCATSRRTIDQHARRGARRRPRRRRARAGGAAASSPCGGPTDGAAPVAAPAAAPRHAHARRLRLARRRLVLEEVELDVVVALASITWPNLPVDAFGGQRTSPRREVEAEGVVGRPRAASSSSDGTGPCGRSARAGWATSGSRATSGAASTSR